MRAVVQRVSNATVTVGSQLVGQIDWGLLIYLGVYRDDESRDVAILANKIPKLRIFEDAEGKMNKAVASQGSQVLVISQFTLCADLNKGNRPSFNPAAPPEKANALYEEFVAMLRAKDLFVATGAFGKVMQVNYTNEGPVTLVVES
ncbi:MAG: D-aminoacyl-tRNA deacylase [Sphaerochaetaceae bacterium]